MLNQEYRFCPFVATRLQVLLQNGCDIVHMGLSKNCVEFPVRDAFIFVIMGLFTRRGHDAIFVKVAFKLQKSHRSYQ